MKNDKTKLNAGNNRVSLWKCDHEVLSTVFGF
jgi:hypothetical protein